MRPILGCCPRFAHPLRSTPLIKDLVCALGLVLCITPRSPLAAQCLMHESVPSDAAAGDNFGFRVAMSGNLCIIGSRMDDAGAVNTGSAYIYRYDPLSGIWNQEAKLIAFDGATGDDFGFAVDVYSSPSSSDIAIVGARHDDDKGTDSGSAYFFKKSGASWNLVSKVTAADGASNDRFAFDVAIAGNHALITSRDDDAPGTNTGSVYAFHFNGTAWTQYSKLVPADVASNDQFGHSVALALKSDGSGAFGIVGSWHDDAPTTNSGSAYIYDFNNQSGVWNQQAKLTPSDSASNDEFGFSVALNCHPLGDVAVIGARNNDDNGTDSGSVYVFSRNGTSWIQQTKLLAADAAANDQFGQSVAICANGNGIMVGANTEDQLGLDAGAAYVFWQPSRDESWTQADKIMANGGVANDLFGNSFAAGGDRGVVGCHQSDVAGNDSGSVHFFAGISGIDNNDNGLADGCELPGDINGDGVVDINDLTILIAGWGVCEPFPQPCIADLDQSGIVEVTDLLIVINNWS